MKSQALAGLLLAGTGVGGCALLTEQIPTTRLVYESSRFDKGDGLFYLYFTDPSVSPTSDDRYVFFAYSASDEDMAKLKPGQTHLVSGLDVPLLGKYIGDIRPTEY